MRKIGKSDKIQPQSMRRLLFVFSIIAALATGYESIRVAEQRNKDLKYKGLSRVINLETNELVPALLNIDDGFEWEITNKDFKDADTYSAWINEAFTIVEENLEEVLPPNSAKPFYSKTKNNNQTNNNRPKISIQFDKKLSSSKKGEYKLFTNRSNNKILNCNIKINPQNIYSGLDLVKENHESIEKIKNNQAHPLRTTLIEQENNNPTHGTKQYIQEVTKSPNGSLPPKASMFKDYFISVMMAELVGCLGIEDMHTSNYYKNSDGTNVAVNAYSTVEQKMILARKKDIGSLNKAILSHYYNKNINTPNPFEGVGGMYYCSIEEDSNTMIGDEQRLFDNHNKNHVKFCDPYSSGNPIDSFMYDITMKEIKAHGYYTDYKNGNKDSKSYFNSMVSSFSNIGTLYKYIFNPSAPTKIRLQALKVFKAKFSDASKLLSFFDKKYGRLTWVAEENTINFLALFKEYLQDNSDLKNNSSESMMRKLKQDPIGRELANTIFDLQDKFNKRLNAQESSDENIPFRPNLNQSLSLFPNIANENDDTSVFLDTNFFDQNIVQRGVDISPMEQNIFIKAFKNHALTGVNPPSDEVNKLHEELYSGKAISKFHNKN